MRATEDQANPFLSNRSLPLAAGVGAGNERDQTDEWNCGSRRFHFLVIFAHDLLGMTDKIVRSSRTNSGIPAPYGRNA